VLTRSAAGSDSCIRIVRWLEVGIGVRLTKLLPIDTHYDFRCCDAGHSPRAQSRALWYGFPVGQRSACNPVPSLVKPLPNLLLSQT
jgi:hypothetical protein